MIGEEKLTEEEIEVKADEYALEESTACNYGESTKHVYQGYFYGFKKGAEFGYNKANEWHFPSKGEYPKDNSFVLVWTENGGITTNYGKEYSDGIPENGLFEGIHISDVIAWKEIELPKEEY